LSTELAIRIAIVILLLSVLLGTALSVFFQNRKSLFNRLLALQLVLVCAWQFAGFMHAFLLIDPSILRPLQMVFGLLAGAVFLRLARAMGGRLFGWPEITAGCATVVFSIYYVLRIVFPGSGNPDEFVLIDTIPAVPATANYIAYTLLLTILYVGGIVVIIGARRHEADRSTRRMMLVVAGSIGVAALSGLAFNNGTYILGVQLPLHFERFIVIGALGLLAYSVLGQQAWSNETLLNIIREKEGSLAERNRIIESELDLARLIHHRLFPEKPPRVPGFDIQGACISTDKVGGDFYDFYTKVQGLGIFIADVSGHGIPAAFIASCTKMAFNYSAAHAENGSQLLKRMDVSIARRAVQSMYVTAVYAEINYANRTLAYCNAGHCPILLHRRADDTVEFLKAKGSPLGLMTGKPFEERILPLLSGDRIIFFTDGLTESVDMAKKPFGEDRFKEFIRTGRERSAGELTTSVIQEIINFTGRARLEDDSTIVVVDVL